MSEVANGPSTIARYAIICRSLHELEPGSGRVNNKSTTEQHLLTPQTTANLLEYSHQRCNKVEMPDPRVDVDGWHIRKFPVPDPPQKPDFIQGADNIHWSQFSRRLAAKLSDDKTRFDIQP
jgi:hypothetical protein